MIQHRVSLLLLLASLSWTAPVLGAEDCPVFLLKKAAGGVTLERDTVPDGQLQAYPVSPETGLIDIILPVGPGVSTGISRLESGTMLLVRCAGGGVHRQARLPDGKQFDTPERPLSELRRYNIRVSVSNGPGEGQAFLIHGYERVAPDLGLVQNLLAGQNIPLQETDYIITTDTYPSEAGPSLEGTVEVELAGHPFARALAADGSEVWFLVDTGGAETLVARSFLPVDAPIEKSQTVQYSSSGRQVLDYSPGGATGQIAGIVGHTRLAELRVGGMIFPDAQVSVIDKMPDFFDRPIAGVLGIDQLGRAGRLILEFPPEARGPGRFRLATEEEAIPRGARLSEIPFSLVLRHLVLPISANGSEAHFILDTGAPTNLLDLKAAGQIGMMPASTPAKQVRGLDGGQTESFNGTVEQLQLGTLLFEQVPCKVAALTAFSSLQGENQRLGLLGNSFLGRFQRVEIDFSSHQVRFVY